MEQKELVSSVVQEVLRQLGPGRSVVTASTAAPSAPARRGNGSSRGGAGGAAGSGDRTGIFGDVNSAVDAATRAQQQLQTAGLSVRDGICKLIKRIAKDNADDWGRVELEETKI